MVSQNSEKAKWKSLFEKKEARSDAEELIKHIKKNRTEIELCRKYLPKGRILDAGCGLGAFVFYFERLGYQAYGIDFIEEIIERNRKIAQKSRFLTMDVSNLKFPTNYFDGYLSIGVIEHLKNPKKALEEAYRVLKRNGVAFIAVPNKLSPWCLTRKLSALLDKSLPWQKEYTKWELHKIATSVGFKCVKSFNFGVAISLRLALGLEHKKLRGVLNPFYPLRRIFYLISERIEKRFSIFGYHTIFVGRK